MDITPETEKKLQQLQVFEQNLQTLQAQRQALQLQIGEIDSALEELNTTKKAYKIVSTIMVASDIPKLKTDLESKKEVLGLRIKTLEKQEKSTKDKASSLQEEVLKRMKPEGG